MDSLSIRFISSNEFKIKEAKDILSKTGLHILPVPLKIEELQTENTERLVKDKALKAYEQIGRPLFVEHTGLYLRYLNDLPGGLTQIFWDTLQADRFAELFGNSSDTSVKAKTVIGYIDGKKFSTFSGEIEGKIAPKPSGNRDFQWDCVFIPNGYDKTFADLGAIKNDISMRRKAIDQFADYLIHRGKV